MIAVGDRLPARLLHVTARHVVLGAMASRDWQPQHHDHAHAIAAGLPDIILNTPTQIGWFCAFLTDWAGPEARIARWRLKMMAPITPGMDIVISGKVRMVDTIAGLRWIEVDLAAQAGELLCSSAHMLVALLVEGGVMPWHLDGAVWAPPPLSGSIARSVAA